MGQRQMGVCGEGRAVDRGHLLRLTAQGGASAKAAELTIDRVVNPAQTFWRGARRRSPSTEQQCSG